MGDDQDPATPAGASDLAPLTFPPLSSLTGTVPVDVHPDVRLLRMPLPYALDHVNLYLVRGEKGWVIVDTGLDSSESRAIWQEVFTGPLRGETVIAVLCTHFHVDHVGLAGFLTERWRVPLLMSYEEYFTQRGWPVNLQEVPWQHADFFRRAGYPDDLLVTTLMMFRFFRQISPMPPAFVRLQDGAPIPVLGSDWRVIIGRGHSPEHAMLYSPERSLLISGDQLLPMISSNVSVSVLNPEDEPLSGWLLSLDRLAELPEDVLVFPSHGVPFRGVKRRVAELHAHHNRKFQVILDVCADRSYSAYELAQIVSPPPLHDFDLLLALGECLAHIRYLTTRGRLEGVPDDHGVLRYRVSRFPLCFSLNMLQ